MHQENSLTISHESKQIFFLQRGFIECSVIECEVKNVFVKVGLL